MADLLAGIGAKLVRASEHVEEFDADCRAFLDDKPWSIDQQFDDDSGFYVGRFMIHRHPPEKIAVIAAEAVGQCRSILDHLIAAAVRLDHPGYREPPHFPIIHKIDDWTANRKALGKVLRPQQVAMIERLQPCKRKLWPRADCLRYVQAFSNLDKHDALIPAFIQAAALWRVRIPDPNLKVIRFSPDGLNDLGDGTELYRVRFRDETDVYVPFNFDVEMAVSVPPTKALPAFEVTLDGLLRIVSYTRAVIDDFREVTPEFSRA